MIVANELDTFHGQSKQLANMPTASIDIGVIKSIDEINMTAAVSYPKKGSTSTGIAIAGLFQFEDSGNIQFPPIGTQVVVLNSPPLRPIIICSLVGRNSASNIISDCIVDEQLLSTPKNGFIKEDIDGGVINTSSERNSIFVSNEKSQIMSDVIVEKTAFSQKYTSRFNDHFIEYQKIALDPPNLKPILYEDIIDDNNNLDPDKVTEILTNMSQLIEKINISSSLAKIYYNSITNIDIHNPDVINNQIEQLNAIFDMFLLSYPDNYLITQSGSATNNEINTLFDVQSLGLDDLISVGNIPVVHQISIISDNTSVIALQILKDGSVIIPNLQN